MPIAYMGLDQSVGDVLLAKMKFSRKRTRRKKGQGEEGVLREKCVRAYASSVVSALEERLRWATAAAVAAKLDGR